MANQQTGVFIGTTPLFDVGSLQDLNQARELIIRLTQKINEIIIALNLKDTGRYVLNETVNSQIYFPNPVLTDTTPQAPFFRQVYRKVFISGPLPNNAQLLIPHGIAPTALFTFTRIYGCASDTTNLLYIPLPESFVNGHIVDLSVNGTDIVINTNWNASNYNTFYIICEYLKS